MYGDTVKDLANEMSTLLDELKPMLPDEPLSEIEGLVFEFKEYGPAIENLCTLLGQRHIDIADSAYDTIMDVFKAMNYPDDAVQFYQSKLRRRDV